MGWSGAIVPGAAVDRGRARPDIAANGATTQQGFLSREGGPTVCPSPVPAPGPRKVCAPGQQARRRDVADDTLWAPVEEPPWLLAGSFGPGPSRIGAPGRRRPRRVDGIGEESGSHRGIIVGRCGHWSETSRRSTEWTWACARVG